jgi:uncharacterized integral membrane protein
VLRRIVSTLIVVPLAVILIAFAVANRQSVTVSFDPFSSTSPAYVAALPLFALIFALRKLESEVRVLHQELDAIRRRSAAEPPPAAREPVPYTVIPPPIT